MNIKFDQTELDTDRISLIQGSSPVSLEPLVFDLLCYLIENRDQVISKEALLEQVWHGRIVADTTIATAIKTARKALGDSGDKQKYIETIRGRGFRFNTPESLQILGAADQDQMGAKHSHKTDESAVQQAASFVKPSLLILPFEHPAASSEKNDVPNNLDSELSRILFRIPLLQQLNSNTLPPDDRCTLSARKAYEQYHVRYLVTAAGNLIDNTAKQEYQLHLQLTDCKSGFQLWAQRFVCEPGNDCHQLLVEIVSQLEPQLQKAIYEDIVSEQGEKNSLALYFQASGLLATKGWHEQSFIEAAALLRESIRQTPNFALAYGYLSLLLAFGHRVGLALEPEAVSRESLEMSEKALDLDSNDSMLLGFVGCAYCDLNRPERGVPLLQKALSINPDNAQARVALGAVKLATGHPSEGIQELQKGIASSPKDARLAIWQSFLASALLATRNVEEAIREAEQACQRSHKAYLPYVVLAAALLVSKDIARASQNLSEAFRIKHDLNKQQIAALVGDKLAQQLLQLQGEAIS